MMNHFVPFLSLSLCLSLFVFPIQSYNNEITTVTLPPTTTPDHIHLSLSEDANQMNVIWTTFPALGEPVTQSSYVRYGQNPNDLSQSTLAISRKIDYVEKSTQRYTLMHYAKMVGLLPSSTYYYQVGSNAVSSSGESESDKKNWSKIYQFVAPSISNAFNEEETYSFLAFGDMGIFEDGLAVINAMERYATPTSHNKVDFVLHVGDMAYGFGNFTKWNTFFERIQRIATHVPYMISPGNRDEPEIVKERFVFPSIKNQVIFSTGGEKGSNGAKETPNFYYGFDYGYMHILSISIRDDYEPGSEQYLWLERQLKYLALRVQDTEDSLQWILVIGHTPLYSSSNGHTGGNQELKKSVEHLLYSYGVSLAIWGDDHNYERTYPVYNDKEDSFYQKGRNEEGDVAVFVNPSKPIHILAGTGGIGLDGWTDPHQPPAWSAYREISHGFLHVTVSPTTLKGKFIRKDRSVSDQFWIVKQQSVSGTRYMALFLAVAFLGALMLYMKKKRIGTVPVLSMSNKKDRAW